MFRRGIFWWGRWAGVMKAYWDPDLLADFTCAGFSGLIGTARKSG